jgi:hypothetical protein
VWSESFRDEMWEVPGKPLCIRMEPLQQRTRGAREWAAAAAGPMMDLWKGMR